MYRREKLLDENALLSAKIFNCIIRKLLYNDSKNEMCINFTEQVKYAVEIMTQNLNQIEQHIMSKYNCNEINSFSFKGRKPEY